MVWLNPTHVASGRLDDLLKNQEADVGGLAFRMNSISDGQCRINIPLGGVIKNYQCRGRLGFFTIARACVLGLT